MKGDAYEIYSISISRIIIGAIFLLVGAANVVLIDSAHQAGVLFPLPYWITTGIPPALFGLGILLHTLINSFKFTLSYAEGDICMVEKFLFRHTKCVELEEVQSIRFGNTRNRFKYAIFGLWVVYIYFTLESGLHQLNELYGAVMIASGLIVLVLVTLFVFLTRKEIVLETKNERIFAIVTKLDMEIVRQILQLPPTTSENSKSYKMNDYQMLGIGLLFILLGFLIYFVLPFSTFVDIFLWIYGMKLIFSVIHHSTGTFTVVNGESGNLIHQKGPLRETILFSKGNSELTAIKKFKPLHIVELPIIVFLCFQAIYATIRSVFLADAIFLLQSILITALIVFAFLVIILRLENYLPFPKKKYYPLPSGGDYPKQEQLKGSKHKFTANFFEEVVKYSQVNALYYRLAFVFGIILAPLLVFSLSYPILI